MTHSLFFDIVCFMKMHKIEENGQIIRQWKHDGSKGFYYIDENDEQQHSDKNPGVRELIIYRVGGTPIEDPEKRFVVAFYDVNDELVRLRNGFDKRGDAEIAAFAISSMYPTVLVLDTDYRVPKHEKLLDAESDPEMFDRDKYESYSSRPEWVVNDKPRYEFPDLSRMTE